MRKQGPFLFSEFRFQTIIVVMYRYLARTPEGFVQQLVLYVSKGYHLFVVGQVPEGKDPQAVDRKLIERYDLALSKWQRARRKQEGAASVQYLRCGASFVLIATYGRHSFFDSELSSIKSCKEAPIVFRGYSISCRSGRVHVRIRLDEYRRLKHYFAKEATRRGVAWWEEKFRRMPFEPYAPVRVQVFNLLRMVNRARRAAGLPNIDWKKCVRTRRRPVKVFSD